MARHGVFVSTVNNSPQTCKMETAGDEGYGVVDGLRLEAL